MTGRALGEDVKRICVYDATLATAAWSWSVGRDCLRLLVNVAACLCRRKVVCSGEGGDGGDTGQGFSAAESAMVRLGLVLG